MWNSISDVWWEALKAYLVVMERLLETDVLFRRCINTWEVEAPVKDRAGPAIAQEVAKVSTYK